MHITNNLLDEEFPIKYFYCSFNNSEFILAGDKEGLIYSTYEKTNIGNILIRILENDNKFIELLEQYKTKIQNESLDEDTAILYLQNLQQDLNKLCNYFKYTNTLIDTSKKYIELFNRLNIEKQKYTNNVEKFEKLKNLLDFSFSENKQALDNFAKHNEYQKSKVANLQNINFKDFAVSQLKLYIEDFSLSLFSILLYCQKNDVDFTYGENKFSTNKDFIAYNYNLLCENRKFNSFIKGVCEIDNKIITDEDLKQMDNNNISFVHIYQFSNIIELLNLSFLSTIEKKVNINICKNCHKLFITQNRTDEVYCDRISPQNKNKTCKEYGAKKTYRDEIKSDPVKSEHNRTSQFYRMKIKRSSNEKEKEKLTIKFDKYKVDFKKKNKKYDNKKITEREFVEWIKCQKLI